MKYLLLILATVAWIASGCSNLHPKRFSTANASAPLNHSSPSEATESESDSFREQRAEAFARFATGVSYELSDKSELAIQEFYKAALADPANEALALDLAIRFLKTKEPDKAIELLSKTASLPQASGKVFSLLAQAYISTGETNRAITASRSAILKEPSSIFGYQVLADIFLKQGKADEVIKLLGSASRQTNDDALFLVGLGELHAKLFRTQPKEADAVKSGGLEALNRASNLKPTNPNVRQKLAGIYNQLGDSKSASELYLELLEEFRDLPLMRDTLRGKLANIYLQGRDKGKAAEQLEEIVRENPTRYPEAWYYLGAFAADAKDWEKAAEYYNRALVVNPEMEQAYYDLAGVQLSRNQAGEALKTLEKARAKFSDSFTVEFFTGLAFAQMKSYPEAVRHFTASELIGNATETNRLNHLFYFQLGTAFERNKDYTQAEKYFEMSLKLSPDFAEALNYLGFMWADRGVNLEKARGLLEKAVKLEPKNAAFVDSLGWVLFKLNQPESALENLLKAAELSDEPDASIYDHIGDVYQSLKQTEKAIAAWRKSLSLEPNEVIEKKLKATSSPL